MPQPDETFIVRVRHEHGDAIVEQPRLSRRRRVRDLSQLGDLVQRWLGPRSVGRDREQDRPTDVHGSAP